MGMFALGTALFAAGLLAPQGETAQIPNGGTFRIGHSGDIPFIDPALNSPFGETNEIMSLTCVSPLNYVDGPRARLVAEAATGFPRISNNRKTYTFRIRKGLRFNTGPRVTARTFVGSVNRALRIGLYPAGLISDIVGAEDVVNHRASKASGIKASGDRLIVTLTAPSPDFLFRVVSPAFCAVPIGLPIDPEGIRAPLPSAAPYFVSSFVPGKRIVVKRNPRYRGRRPHHVDQFVMTYGLDLDAIVTRIERGQLDTGDVGLDARLARRYGRSQYFVRQTPFVFFMVFNTARPLFRDVRMRRAVNFAINRRALVRAGVPALGQNWGVPYDRFLTPKLPGYRPARIYPFGGSAAKARRLAKQRRGRKHVTLYTRDVEQFVAWAQLVERNLERVGFDVTTKAFPPDVLGEKLAVDPWDLAFAGRFAPDYPDPAGIIGLFAEPPTPVRYRRSIERASRLVGNARYRLFGKLDIDLARNVAPWVVFASPNTATFVSKRVGCKIFRPELDLAAVCLKR